MRSALASVLMLVLTSAPLDPSVEDLCNLVRGFQRELVNLECEYEGSIVFTKEIMNTNQDVPNTLFTGLFLRRADGAWLYDGYEKGPGHSGDRVYRKTTAILHGQRSVLGRYIDQAKAGGGEITDARFPRLYEQGSPTQVLCIDHLVSGLDDPDKRLEIQRAETVGGHRCQVLDLIEGSDPAKDHQYTITWRFWIDLERGGNPIRIEKTYPGREMITRLVVDDVEQFDAGERKLWLPTKATFEGFAWGGPNRTIVRKSFPTSRERIFLIRDSIRFPKEIPDSRFKVNYTTGTMISDNLKQKQVEFSKQKPVVANEGKRPTRDESEHQLQEQLRLAEEQKKELRASSWEREGDFPLGVVALVVGSVVVLAVGGFLLLRQRMS